MRRSQRLISLAVLIALCGVLAGCSSLSNFDPSDLLDFLDSKKKLPGDRKPVFPEGVPGLQQGVPKELYKGAAQQPDTGPAVAALPPVQEPVSPSRGRKSRSRPANVTAAPSPDAAPDPATAEEGSTAAAPPAPKKKIVRRRTTAPPPDAAAAEPAQPAPQAATSAFPAPLPGTLQR